MTDFLLRSLLKNKKRHPSKGIPSHLVPVDCLAQVRFGPYVADRNLLPGARILEPHGLNRRFSAKADQYQIREPPQRVALLFGAGDRTRTGTLSPAVDFESTTSTNSITPAGAKFIIQR